MESYDLYIQYKSPMKTHNPAILNTIAKLKVTHPEFVEQSGLGYCANASLVLKEELSKIGVEGKLLYGKYLKDNRAGQVAKAHFSNLIKHFPISNGFHGRVKSHYVKNGNKISDKGGHVGVLVGSDVYDVTSAQFGLPIAYPLEKFLDMWGDAHVVDITLGPKKTAWTQKVLYSYQTKDQQAVSMESYGSAMGFEASEDKDRAEFMHWFTTQSKEVQSNSRIVSSDELGQDYMLHIDKTTPEVFTPMMPRSAGDYENNTTARITVAPDLVGCVIGYARVEDDFVEGTDPEKIKTTGFRGGYDICELQFKHCLAPNKELVYDAEISGEHWLVSYNKDTTDYYPSKVGSMFLSDIKYIAVTGQKPLVIVTYYLQITKEAKINYGLGHVLSKGHYKCTLVFDRKVNRGDLVKDRCTVSEITGLDYMTAKKLNAAMLSMESNNKPKYLNW